MKTVEATADVTPLPSVFGSAASLSDDTGSASPIDSSAASLAVYTTTMSTASSSTVTSIASMDVNGTSLGSQPYHAGASPRTSPDTLATASRVPLSCLVTPPAASNRTRAPAAQQALEFDLSLASGEIPTRFQGRPAPPTYHQFYGSSVNTPSIRAWPPQQRSSASIPMHGCTYDPMCRPRHQWPFSQLIFGFSLIGLISSFTNFTMRWSGHSC